MQRVPITTIRIRKIRPRPTGFVHRLHSMFARVASRAFSRLHRALITATSSALEAYWFFLRADGDRKWEIERQEEIARAYEDFVREPSPFLDEHRDKWMRITEAGDVHVFESLDDVICANCDGFLHVVGDPVVGNERPLLS